MNKLNQQIRITPALEKALLSTSSYFKREDEGKMRLVMFGLLRLIILVALIFCVLSAGATAMPASTEITGATAMPGAKAMPASTEITGATAMPGGGQRRTVGVVLSGGGAKGLAHIGVLKALEEFEVPIDYIAGTSMGAIVGSMYAAGFSPGEIEAFVHSAEFRNASAGHIGEDHTYFFFNPLPNPAWFSLRMGWEDRLEAQNVIRQNIPANIVSPFLMDLLFMENLAPASAAATGNFDRLMVPFRCVATDVEGRKEVVFRSGSLPDAVRASMTFPFYFQPITIDGKLMMDGGMYNNFPADVLYADFKPDVMIGCNVSGNPEPPTRSDVISHLQNLLMHPTRYELQAELSVLIEPDVPQLSVTDFSQTDYLIRLGYESAIERLGEIFSMIDGRMPAEELSRKREAFNFRKPDLVIQQVQVDGLDPGTAEYVLELIKPDEGPTTLSLVRERYLRMLSHERFEHVYPRLQLDPVTGFFDFCLEMEKSREMLRSFGGNISSQHINQLFTKLQYRKLKRNPFTLSSSLYIGNFYNSGSLLARIDFPRRIPVYISGYAVYSRWKFASNTLFFFEEQKPTFMAQREAILEGRVGVAMGNHGKIEAGAFLLEGKDQYYNTPLFTRTDTMDVTRFTPTVAFFTYERSTLNRKQYPNRGSYVNLTLRYVTGNETHKPGSTSLHERASEARRSWAELSLHYENFFLPGSRFNPGFVTDFFISNRPLFTNYTSSLVMARQFSPFPLTATRFLPDFRANHYVAAGLKSIYTLSRSASIQAEGYFFQPLRSITQGVSQEPFYRSFITNASVIGNLAFVYHFPPGPLSLNLSYLPDQEDRWAFMLNFGYILFNRQAFMR